jgi:hypothetical protein
MGGSVMRESVTQGWGAVQAGLAVVPRGARRCAGCGDFMPSTPLKIMVNNQRCAAALTAPKLGSATADNVCGVLKYGTDKTAKVTLGYAASHPANYATYSLSINRGASTVLTPVSSAHLPQPGGLLQVSVADLLGPCPVAGIAECLYIATTINNGWGRQSQYDASAAFAFVLTP